jgi:hypothetical protein
LDFWLARGAVALIAGLQLLFVNNNLVFGPGWLAPAFELAMLALGPDGRNGDTMPLSAQSKLLMAAEATISLLAVGLVAARAVNILT